MAWGKAGYNQEDDRSKRVDRVDRLLSQLNLFWLSPLNTDDLTHKPYFEIIFRILKTLSSEISPDINSGESDKENELREEIETLLKTKPLFKKVIQQSLGSKKSSIKVDEKAWNDLEPKLYAYDRLVRKLLANNLGEKLYIDSEDSDMVVNVDEELGY